MNIDNISHAVNKSVKEWINAPQSNPLCMLMVLATGAWAGAFTDTFTGGLFIGTFFAVMDFVMMVAAHVHLIGPDYYLNPAYDDDGDSDG